MRCTIKGIGNKDIILTEGTTKGQIDMTIMDFTPAPPTMVLHTIVTGEELKAAVDSLYKLCKKGK